MGQRSPDLATSCCQRPPLRSLRAFSRQSLEWVPYLYPDLGEGVSETDERAAIEAGITNATGFRYMGTVAQEEAHLGRTGRTLAEPYSVGQNH